MEGTRRGIFFLKGTENMDSPAKQDQQPSNSRWPRGAQVTLMQCPVCWPRQPDSACKFCRGLGIVSAIIAPLDPDTLKRALENRISTLTPSAPGLIKEMPESEDLLPIHSFNFSTRCLKAFRRLDIKSVHELLRLTADNLLEAKNFGEGSLEEVRQKLHEHGLFLRGEEDDLTRAT